MFTLDHLLYVVDRMQHFPSRWWVAGGFAIELFIGKSHRDHGDIEIGLLRQDQHQLQTFFPHNHWQKAITVNDKGEWLDWHPEENLALPIFQLKTFFSDQNFESEFFLDEGTDSDWLFRRDITITCPWSQAIRRTPDNIPILAPELQLLYKAKNHRNKDEQDFQNALPLMSPDQRRWLKSSLRHWNPKDPWLAEL